MPFTDKFDALHAIEAALESHPHERKLLDWLTKVWNTDDDRSFEEFDPNKPYGANYDPDEDICEKCGERRQDNCYCGEEGIDFEWEHLFATAPTTPRLVMVKFVVDGETVLKARYAADNTPLADSDTADLEESLRQNIELSGGWEQFKAKFIDQEGGKNPR